MCPPPPSTIDLLFAVNYGWGLKCILSLVDQITPQSNAPLSAIRLSASTRVRTSSFPPHPCPVTLPSQSNFSRHTTRFYSRSLCQFLQNDQLDSFVPILYCKSKCYFLKKFFRSSHEGNVPAFRLIRSVGRGLVIPV